MKKFNRPQQNLNDFFVDNIDVMAAMTGMITTQQGIAVNLTKLALEHCVGDKITKEKVFEVYKEACDLLKVQMDECIGKE